MKIYTFKHDLTSPSLNFEKLLTRFTLAIRHVQFHPRGNILAVAGDEPVVRLGEDPRVATLYNTTSNCNLF